jgi:succinylglutamate desuccinylase
MEDVSRHAITPEDRFVMEAGFMNLARVSANRLLAHDRNGAIRAPRDGFVLLPLYQGQGSDGFFWGRDVSPARLRFSEALRQMRLDRFFDLLPGIRRDPAHPARLVVEERVSRLYPAAVFQTFGYRRVRKNADATTLERQAASAAE